MIWETLNLGTSANSGDGDDLHTAFTTVKNNLDYLKSYSINTINNSGTGTPVLKYIQGSNILTALSMRAGNNIDIGLDGTGTSLVISSVADLASDTSPSLSSNLNTNGHEIHNYSDGLYKNLKLNDVVISRNVSNTETTVSSSIPLRFSVGTGYISFDNNINAKAIISTGIYGPTNGVHTGSVIGNVTGNLSGNTTGLHTGNVVGNVSGTVSDITNHSIKTLNDVSDNTPSIGTTLIWNGSQYVPSTTTATNLTTAQRNALTPTMGMFIFNTDTHTFQGYNNTSWVDIA